jgi:UDP-N-acetylglucosamine--N-acetylmuramyl-(pentapeptide) pyrophosphoryl-undecaprenol N-acetylglucosamine transferase
VVPALAVAGALRAEGARVEFIGGDRAEAELVPAAGFELRRIAVEGMSRTNPLHAARERLGLAAGRDCVLVFGGSLGARSINLAAIEAFAGAPSVDASPVDASSVDASALDMPALDAKVPSAHGSAHGEAAGAPTARRAFDVLHVAGRRDYPELSARALSEGYVLREYLDLEQFGDALAVADLVVARAGGSVFEIAASGTPAILVPYPHASADHQTENARWMERAGAAVAIPDGELDASRLAREVGDLLADRERLATMATASQGLARPDAARDIADELLEASG